MSDDDLELKDGETLVKGKVVPKETLAGSDTNSSLGQGLFYLGVTLVLLGPLRVLLQLPADLSTVESVSMTAAWGPIAIGVMFMFSGGLYAVLTSPPVLRVWIAVRDRVAGGVDELADPSMEEAD